MADLVRLISLKIEFFYEWVLLCSTIFFIYFDKFVSEFRKSFYFYIDLWENPKVGPITMICLVWMAKIGRRLGGDFSFIRLPIKVSEVCYIFIQHLLVIINMTIIPIHIMIIK